jgi:hypothetical protein
MVDKKLNNFIKTTIREFLNEQINNDKLSEIKDDEIRVYETFLRTLCSGVGEGINDLDVNSVSLSGKWTPNTDEFQNEIFITFYDNAWGGIDLSEWNVLEKRLNEYVGKNGFYDFSINTTRNLLTLTFDGDYEMGLY